MKTFYFSGDMSHPCIVKIRAASEEKAVAKAKNGEFDEIMDEQDDCLLFVFNGDILDKEEVMADDDDDDDDDEEEEESDEK